MRFINLFPGRCRKTLHAIIGGAQQYGAQRIDDEVQTRIDLSSLVAITLEKNPASCMDDANNCHCQIGDADYGGSQCAIESAEPPTLEPCS